VFAVDEKLASCVAKTGYQHSQQFVRILDILNQVEPNRGEPTQSRDVYTFTADKRAHHVETRNPRRQHKRCNFSGYASIAEDLNMPAPNRRKFIQEHLVCQ